MTRSKRIDIAGIRREEIVEAAIEIITVEGLPALSLSKIEKKARMSRGQLTYYFHNKEDILLAVFDRLIQLMYERLGQNGCEANRESHDIWALMEQLLRLVLRTPDPNPEFHALQYTFLSQIGHREDFRGKLASLYEGWRKETATLLAEQIPSLGEKTNTDARLVAGLFQAMLHGLSVQKAADPDAFESEQMVTLCLNVLKTYLQRPGSVSETNKKKPTPSSNGTSKKRRGTSNSGRRSSGE